MGVLMNLTAFAFRDLQNCMAILTVLEGAGIIDIPTARMRLAELSRRERQESKPTYVSRHKKKSMPDPACPVCGWPMYPVVVDKEDQIAVLGCKHCRYSTPVEVA